MFSLLADFRLALAPETFVAFFLVETAGAGIHETGIGSHGARGTPRFLVQRATSHAGHTSPPLVSDRGPGRRRHDSTA
jgi:hypothetical protein